MDNKAIENIFHNSNDPDELFDAFHMALKSGIRDIELYKIFLANPALSEDEICMYTEKLSSVMPENAFELFIWVAQLFETQTHKLDLLDKSMQYYAKAAKLNPQNHLPYKLSINLYNYEIDIPINKHVIRFIKDGILQVEKKSQLYLTLANHYKKTGNYEEENRYKKLAQKDEDAK